MILWRRFKGLGRSRSYCYRLSGTSRSEEKISSLNKMGQLSNPQLPLSSNKSTRLIGNPDSIYNLFGKDTESVWKSPNHVDVDKRGTESITNQKMYTLKREN